MPKAEEYLEDLTSTFGESTIKSGELSRAVPPNTWHPYSAVTSPPKNRIRCCVIKKNR